MVSQLKREKGSASVGLILIVAFMIVFVVIPLSAYIFDNLKVNLISRDVAGAIDVAIEDGYHSLQKPILSKEDFIVDGPILQYYVTERLKKSLYLNDDLAPKANSKLEGPFSIELLNFVGTANLPYTELSTGKVYTRPFVEVQFTIRLKPTLYRDLILNALGKSYIEFSAKRKTIIYVNN